MQTLYEAQCRHAQYYLNALQAHDQLYAQGGNKKVSQALEQFNRDWGQYLRSVPSQKLF